MRRGREAGERSGQFALSCLPIHPLPSEQRCSERRTHRLQLSDLIQLARQLVSLLRETREGRLLVVGAPRQIRDGLLESFRRLNEPRSSQIDVSPESVNVGLMRSLEGEEETRTSRGERESTKRKGLKMKLTI